MNIKAHTSIIGETGYNNHSRNFFTAINKFHKVKIRNFTVGKSWKGNNKTPHEGENYLSKEHKEMLYEQILWVKDSERGNFPIYSFDESFVPDINITLEPMNHYLFYDNHKGYNVGYNVWETTEYPQSFFNLIHKYDQFWVPTKWQKDNLVKQGYPQDKVKIVPEGIDPEVFKPAAKKPADKFRFILFGKWEYRKSTQEILSCFLEVFKHSDDVELIASIDNDYKVEMGQTIKKKLKDLGLENDKIKLLHFPPASEYIDHLQQGDVFISCARSEGWNLPLIEAMACGVPSIYSNWGSQLEFAGGRGIPVKIKGEIPAINDDGSILPGNYCEPDWEDFKRVLLSSYKEHKALKEKALKDSDEIRRIFTWENAAKIASQHLTKSHFNFESFFSKYKTHIDKKSVCRSKFYEYVIPKLIELGRPIYVLETGTMSTSLEDNSGAFTLIMADLIKNYTGGKIYTVDLSKENIQKCKNLTKEFKEVIEYASVDSIEFIKSLDKDTVKKFDLVYLDSYDLWLPDPHNSAQHHLNELLSLFDNINDTCFIGIDDNYLPGSWVLWNHLDGKGDIIKQEKIVIKDNVVGKGQYCESFLIKNGWIRNKSINLVGGNNVFLYEKTDIGDSDTKDKILYISPHLSTGGLPQYLLKKIESLVGDYEIVCVEYANISTKCTVQKLRIENILGDKLITLGDRKEQLIEIINTFKPDVIHLEEIPEYFMRSDISNFIYSSSRSYKIIETSHDSSFEIERKIYLPDKFLLVSRYQLENFSKLNIPGSLMEYPIEYKSSINKVSAKQTLGMDPNKKHVINVGLFSSRKNQAEIVEYAKKLLNYPIQFHFIGNQSDNFKSYWEPIMQDFPSNCTWWGERSDVSTFYEAADLFLFTSRGTKNDKETSPIVIRESISNGLTSLIYDLPVYMKMYDKYNTVKYLNFDNLDENCNAILVLLKLDDNVNQIKNWKNEANEMLKFHVSEEESFSERLVKAYKNTKRLNLSNREAVNSVRISFNSGPKIEVVGSKDMSYRVEFIDAVDNRVVYSSNIKNGHWSSANSKYYVNWKINVYNNNNIVASSVLDLENKKVKITIDSSALGDMLAWIGQIDKFQKKHKCIVDVYCKFKEFLFKTYPNLNFVTQSTDDYYASYSVGYYIKENWSCLTPVNPKTVPLCKVASDILGLEYEEIKPKLTFSKKVNDKKYVCIATQSTSQAKYWNNKQGWESVINYLNSKGYEVWCIDKHSSFGNGSVMNFIPKNAIDKTGDISLSERMSQIDGCEFFIGLGSGLSWLAWSLNKPVVLISGFSEPISEFNNPLRVFNPSVCNGCWNDLSVAFDPSNWNWCPRKKDFECSKEISFEMVKEKIDMII